MASSLCKGAWLMEEINLYSLLTKKLSTFGLQTPSESKGTDLCLQILSGSQISVTTHRQEHHQGYTSQATNTKIGGIIKPNSQCYSKVSFILVTITSIQTASDLVTTLSDAASWDSPGSPANSGHLKRVEQTKMGKRGSP